MFLGLQDQHIASAAYVTTWNYGMYVLCRVAVKPQCVTSLRQPVRRLLQSDDWLSTHCRTSIEQAFHVTRHRVSSVYAYSLSFVASGA